MRGTYAVPTPENDATATGWPKLAESTVRHVRPVVGVVGEIEHLGDAGDLEPAEREVLRESQVDAGGAHSPRSALRGTTSLVPITAGPSNRSLTASGMTIGAPRFRRLAPPPL